MFTVPCVPVKRRVRFSKGGTYTDKKTTQEMREVANAYHGPKFTGAVTVGIAAFRKLPKSRPKSVTSEPDTGKPDIDNIVKAVFDGLNGIAWDDDSQVTVVRAEKKDRMRIAHEFTEIIITGETEGGAHDATHL